MYWNYVKLFLAMVTAEVASLVIAVVLGSMLWTWLLLASLVIFAILCTLLVIAYLRMLGGDWEELLDNSFLIKETVDVPMADGWSLVARVVRHPKFEGKKCPAIICHHGLGGNSKRLSWLAAPLAMRGYIVVLPDARGHGDSAKRFKKARKDDWYIDEQRGVLPDYHRIVDYVCSRTDVDTTRIAAIGHSLGGVTTLTSGLVEPRVKLAIPMSPYYSFVDLIEAKRGRKPFSEEWFSKHVLRIFISFAKLRKLDEKISPKYYFKMFPPGDARAKVRLVHCKDDKLVLFEDSSAKIIADLELPPDHILLLEKGDHELRGQETIITMKILEWLTEAGI
nr:alpha/beta fold hydrolase [Candidatus Sigynarchaeota archaeon]